MRRELKLAELKPEALWCGPRLPPMLGWMEASRVARCALRPAVEAEALVRVRDLREPHATAPAECHGWFEFPHWSRTRRPRPQTAAPSHRWRLREGFKRCGLLPPVSALPRQLARPCQSLRRAAI
jgi:hypothetical protein